MRNDTSKLPPRCGSTIMTASDQVKAPAYKVKHIGNVVNG